MTIWGVAGVWLGFVAYAASWHWGGRAERFVAAVLLLHWLAASITFRWIIDGIHSPRMVVDFIRALVLVWFCFRANRWWLLVTGAAEILMAGMSVATLLNPAFYMASASAHVGLGYLADLSLLFGACERSLAGEAPARHAAWARAEIATAARRNRKKAGRRSKAGSRFQWKERTDRRRGRDPRLPA